MKRLFFIALLLIAVGMPALAFDPTPARGNRIGILNTATEHDVVTLRVAALMRGYLSRELEKQGFDVFDTRNTIDDLLRGADPGADFYVEFVRGDGDDRGYGGVGIGGRHGGVGMEVVASSMGAALRIYDGETLDIIDEFDAYARDTALLPTSVGIGGRHAGIWLGLPLQILRHRAVAKAAARDAAASIVAAIDPEADRD
jgi:hypothetical protein